MSSRTSFSASLLAAVAIAAVALPACVRDTPRVTPDASVGVDMPGTDGGMMCTTTATEDTVALCGDGCDNDGSGFFDCNDFDCCSVRSDCPATTSCGMPRPDGGPVTACATMTPETTFAQCSDGCDNDGNRFFDCNDFSCCDVRSDCPMGTACYVMPATTYTIPQLQNRADAMHPTSGDRVSVSAAGMVALTGRVLIGSAMFDVPTRPVDPVCRFAIWVGAPVSGDFTAIQVQELIALPTTVASCFALPDGKINSLFAPGDAVTSINNATYNEFCAGPSGTPPVPCTNFEQSNIFLGGAASTIVRGAAGAAPSGTVVAIADLVGAAGAPGARAVALEGTLLRIEGAQIKSTPDGMFARYSAILGSAPTIELDILVSNFPDTLCVRTHFMTLATGTTTVPSITGVLVPNFGRWTLRIRNADDIAGLTCP